MQSRNRDDTLNYEYIERMYSNKWKRIMKGLKRILFGIAVILIGGFFMIAPDSSLGGWGELVCFVVGIAYGISGLKSDE